MVDVVDDRPLESEAEAGMDIRFLDRVEQTWRTDPQFGVIFTHYDALCAFNMKAVRSIGPWDSLFTGYFSDVEYYGRLRRYGFKEIATEISVIHHRSMTIRSDHARNESPCQRRLRSPGQPAYERIFRELY
jgi:GT2 family glycosyltransferase